ncbi:MAG TPA: hypothetical protein VJ866_11725 [Pyrinomonadaceae bacterium]|nr:hypothetical protein [Pyrinomonadaceae bacterium]
MTHRPNFIVNDRSAERYSLLTTDYCLLLFVDKAETPPIEFPTRSSEPRL